MSMWMPYLLVGLGGFIGANARFVVARLVGAAFETRFPLGTFVINVSGSFLLGVLGTIIALKVMPSSEAMRLAPRLAKNRLIIVNLSGRGDKDMNVVAEYLKASDEWQIVNSE